MSILNLGRATQNRELGRATQNRELQDDEMDAVSGGSSGAFDTYRPNLHASSSNPLIQSFLNGFYSTCGC
jgi:hypothetical protein